MPEVEVFDRTDSIERTVGVSTPTLAGEPLDASITKSSSQFGNQKTSQKMAVTRSRLTDTVEPHPSLMTSGSLSGSGVSSDDQLDSIRAIKKPPRPLPRRHRQFATFVTLQAWEGVVEDVSPTHFRARLADELEIVEEYTEIPLQEVSDADLDLLQPGARFYWSIGYYRSAGGQQSKDSILRFQRIAQRGQSRPAEQSGWTDEIEETWLNL